MGAMGELGPNESLIGQQGSREALSTPALVLDLDRMERNIAYLAGYLARAGHGVRPVAKIHKSVEVAKRQMEAGALGQCCATLAEAEVMADAGIPGVLLFSQVVTEPKIARLADLNARADGLLVAVDDAAVVDRLAAAALAAGKPLRMLVDFEVGGRRTGLDSVDEAVALARHIAEAEGAVYAGGPGLQRLLPARARLGRPPRRAGALHRTARHALRASCGDESRAGDRLRRRHRHLCHRRRSRPLHRVPGRQLHLHGRELRRHSLRARQPAIPSRPRSSSAPR